jgi:hypothetical protein
MKQYNLVHMKLHNSYKLVTKEDPYHIHKFLGGVSLVHFVYRFCLIFFTKSMDLNNHYALGFVYIHGLLSLTSFIFHISNVRNKTAPMIYPEFRLHSIFFAWRSVLCFTLTYYNYSIFYRFLVCYLTMIFADITTHYYKNYTNSSTMRAMPYDKSLTQKQQQIITHLHSSHQVCATLFMLSNLEGCFSPLFAIQIAAFLMTLVRKNIIDSNKWHLFYAFSLFINILDYKTFTLEYIFIQNALMHVFVYLRFHYSMNKYIVWTLCFIIFYFFQVSFPVNDMLEKIIKIGIITCYLGYSINKISCLM